MPYLLNPCLQSLPPYLSERLQRLFEGVVPNPQLKRIDLSIGEPKHPTPRFIYDALSSGGNGLARYPSTIGDRSLRQAIADWIKWRHRLVQIDPDTQIIPTLGSREALFSIAQVALDHRQRDGWAICPNPFYQIYEGAVLCAGLRPYFINALSTTRFRPDWDAVPKSVWQRTQLVFACSPGNPSGAVMTLDEWRALFALSDKHGFVVVSDECYTEIYFDEKNPPLGALSAAEQLCRQGFPRLIVLGSLSKRSSAPGLRSGFAAGDAAIIREYVRYRTYSGSAMGGAVQAASEAAWKDEAHVRESRRLYAEKIDIFHDIVNPVLPLTQPEAAFYYWVEVPIDGREFAVRLLQDANIVVLPCDFMARDAHGVNPGQNFVRIALVSSIEETVEAAHRIRRFSEAF